MARAGSRMPVKSSGFIMGRIIAFVMASFTSDWPFRSLKVIPDFPLMRFCSIWASILASSWEGTILGIVLAC